MKNLVPRVLVCDDEALVREVVEATLRGAGFAPVSTESAEAALCEFSAANSDFALAIVDRGLPGLDGVALIERLRALRADLPVLLASGTQEGALGLERVPGPPVTLLQKPFRPSALLRVVAELLPPP